MDSASENRLWNRAAVLALLALAACTNESTETARTTPPPAAPVDTRPPAPKPETTPAVPTLGKLAPEIVGEDVDGKPIKLSDYRGKVVMLDFWGNW